MRKYFWLSTFITFLLVALGVISVSALQELDEGVHLDSPSVCPSSGCAAGQRLNSSVDFSVDPQDTGVPNTQICVYASADGQEGLGTEPWADFSKGWIAENNTNPSYTKGEQDSICSNKTPTDTEFIVGAYATHTTAKSEQIEFATHINKTSDIAGEVRVKIFQLESNGTANWVETTSSANAFSIAISVAPLENTAYAAETPANCGTHSPCFVHSGDDKPDGQGTGLYDAIQALDSGGEILILKDLRIKTYSVRIDKNLTIKGYDRESMLTSINSDQAHKYPLLSYQAAGVLQNLTVNDGNCCPDGNSRTLVEIDSPDKVTIKNSTLTSGDYGIYVLDKAGEVDIAFNQIANNQRKAVLVDVGTTNPGWVNIYANNIVNNGADVQIDCNSRGDANHNFWGEGHLPTENTSNCIVSNGKQLGAPVLSASNGHGVQAILATVEGGETFNYYSYFNDKIGTRHTEGNDYNIVIVNHGQGGTANIPFYDSDSGDITPCGNFYDIFLAEDASPTNLLLAIKYDLNAFCINTIESDYYCGNENQSRFPLWWYDPANNITEGWDRTGQDPEGLGGGGATGQDTTCNIEEHEIIVEIDLTGRPGLYDLTYTPFITGFIDGAILTDFSAVFTNFYTKVSWQTSRERNIKQYQVLRSKKKDSGYERITEVDVGGDSNTTNTYQFYDYKVDLSNTYYYKLVAIYDSAENEIIGRYGPLRVNLPSPTITNTPTVTRTLYPTRTPYYRTPTRSYYRSSTPAGAPTQVRTYGPSPTGGTKPVFNPSPTSTITPNSDSGYPSGDESATTEPGYPVLEDPTITPTQSAEELRGTQTQQAKEENTNGQDGSHQDGGTQQSAAPGIHLLIGFGAGLTLLLGASVIMAKSFFL